jgi:DNA-binding NarL/FixJ family response regulator
MTTIQQKLKTLTDRQLEVLKLVWKGDKQTVIASELGITLKTVEHHIATIKDKLGLLSYRHIPTIKEYELMIIFKNILEK